MKEIKSQSIIAMGTIVLSLIWIYLGIFKYGLWDQRNKPLPGLFPAGIAAVLLVAGAIALMQSLKEKRAVYRHTAFEVMVSLLLLLAASFTFGMLPSLLVYFVLWQLLIEKTPLRLLILSTLVVGAIVLGVFVFWLKIPFDNGVFFDFILF